jgi:4-hydroxy-3-methylbut-2-enyl diphosphate reductase
MKVLRAKVLGFCMGVRRAVELAEREVRAAAPGQKYYTLGPLIHNPRVLDSLKKEGLEILDETGLSGSLENTTVIIRAHGVSPVVEAELRERGVRVLDATCPKVKANQLTARALAAGGCRIFLAGEEDHGEVAGIRGYAVESGAGDCCIVAGNAVEAEEAAEKLYREAPEAKTALIGQSTISPEEYQSIGEGIKKFFPRLKIADTICGATRDRQDSLRELCGQVEALIVAGGKDSANTRRLLAIARDQGKPCWLVEGVEELPPEISAYERVGICAGASTPDQVIYDIENKLRNCS